MRKKYKLYYIYIYLMKSSWVTHVKAFAQKHKMKYGDALKNAQCKSEYHKSKGK